MATVTRKRKSKIRFESDVGLLKIPKIIPFDKMTDVTVQRSLNKATENTRYACDGLKSIPYDVANNGT